MSSRSSFILRAQETLPLDSYYIPNSRFSLDHSVPASHNDNSFNYPSVIATDVDKPPPSLESSSTNASLSYPPTAHLAGMPKVVISRTKTPATVIRALPNRSQDELEDFTAQIANELRSVLPPNNTTMEPPTDEGCPYAASLPLTGRPDHTLPSNYRCYIPGLRWKKPDDVYKKNRIRPTPLFIPSNAIIIVTFAHAFHSTIWQFILDAKHLRHTMDLQIGTPVIFLENEDRPPNRQYCYHLTRIRLYGEQESYVEAVAFNIDNTIHTEGSINMPPIVLLIPNALLHNFRHQMNIARAQQNVVKRLYLFKTMWKKKFGSFRNQQYRP